LAACGTPVRSNLHTAPNIYVWRWRGSMPNHLWYCMDYAERHPYVKHQMARVDGEYERNRVLVAHATQLRACMYHNLNHAYTQAAPVSTDPYYYVDACMWILWPPPGEEVNDAAATTEKKRTRRD